MTRVVFIAASVSIAFSSFLGTAQDKAPAKGAAAKKDAPAAQAKDPKEGEEAKPIAYDPTIRVKAVPYIRAKTDFDAEACVAMYLKKLGTKLTQDDVFNASGLDPMEGRGCNAKELTVAMQKLGFAAPFAGGKIRAQGASQAIVQELNRLIAELRVGIPSIVCMLADSKPKSPERYRLVLGYDPRKNEVIFHDPVSQNGNLQRMDRATFLQLWPLKYETQMWTVVRFRLRPDKMVEPTPATSFTNADYVQRIIWLKKRIPKDFSLTLKPPFVVLSDEPAAKLEERAKKYVAYGARLLKKGFFTKDPKNIVNIWLFKDNESYDKHIRTWFKQEPRDAYGYYSKRYSGIFVNVAKRPGTIVQEMAYPYLESNFPQCPPWFAAGLATLYSQSAEREGRVLGFTDWRLKGLQRSILRKTLPSIQDLTKANAAEFVEDITGTNYAHARYLCYYLQQKKVLRTYYQELQKNIKEDPTGAKTLLSVMKVSDMAKFRKNWERYIKLQRFYE